MKILYSVIVPVYNEVDSLDKLFSQIQSAMNAIGVWELIFIDDGSTDGSQQSLKRIVAKNKLATVISFRRNQGKAMALQAGFQAAKGDIIITLDADLQDDPAEIKKLISALNDGHDLVSGLKKNRHDPIDKTIPSYFFNLLIRRIFKLPIHDVNCGLKVYRRKVVESLAIYGELYRFIPILAANEGFKIAEVEVKHRPRQFGRSKFGPSRFARGFLDLFTVLFLTRFLKRPLHFFGTIGLACLAVGIIVCLYLTYLHFGPHIKIGNRPLLLFGVLLIIAGLQFIFTGLIAELVTHYAQRNIAQAGYDESNSVGCNQK